MNACLYTATFPNGKLYFGVTVKRLRLRELEHRYSAKQPRPPFPFQKALKKYGNAVTFTTLVVGKRDYILELERRAIEAFQTRDPRYGYNVTLGGEMPHWTSETRAKTSATLKGRVFSPETIAKMSAAKKGLPRSLEAREKQSASMKGRAKTPEHQAKITTAVTGLRHSSETKQRLSALAKGRVLSPETRAKIAADSSSRSSESRRKISAALKGRKFSPEWLAKLSEASKRRADLPESKEKLAAANMARVWTLEMRANASTAAKARWALRRGRGR